MEVVEAYLQRIDDLDFKFNSYITVLWQQALEEARLAEQEIVAGNYRGPLHGIPVGVKDQIWTKGIRTTGGARITADFVPDEDATVIARLKDAGAILLGKTNLSEFAITGFTHRFSTPRNPWDLNISAGGSSGGSGAATAAFLCATSLGEDTGGSIRRPGGVVRRRGPAARLGPGQPIRPDARRVVHGHHRPHFPHGGGRGHHLDLPSPVTTPGTRPRGTRRCPTTGRPLTATYGASGWAS